MKFLSKIIALGAFLLSNCAFSLQPYIGAEAQVKYVTFEGHALKAIKKHTIQPHALVGLKITDYFSLEAGATLSERFNEHYSHSLKGVHLGALLRLPVNDDLAFIGSFGATGYHCYLANRTNHIIKIPYGYIGHKETMANDSTSWIGKKSKLKAFKVIPRIMGGAEIKLNSDLYLRGSIIWEKLNEFRNKDSKLQNGLNLSLGLIYIF